MIQREKLPTGDDFHSKKMSIFYGKKILNRKNAKKNVKKSFFRVFAGFFSTQFQSIVVELTKRSQNLTENKVGHNFEHRRVSYVR